MVHVRVISVLGEYTEKRERDIRRSGNPCDTNDLQWCPSELGRRTYVRKVVRIA